MGQGRTVSSSAHSAADSEAASRTRTQGTM